MESKIALIFDVETTGLLNTKPPYPRLDACPYVLQFSYIMYDVANGVIVKMMDSYVKIPDSITIPKQASDVNGITREHCEGGRDMIDILKEFYKDYHKCNILVAHNYNFDSNMLTLEMQRYWAKLKPDCPFALNLFQVTYMNDLSINFHCTMNTTADLCKIPMPNKYNKPIDPSKPIRYKWPTLLELYKHLFHEEPKNLHNSLMDCMVCLRCFLKIYNNYDFAEGKFDVFVNRFMPVKK